MTRAEILNDIIRITNQDYEAVRRMKAHDQAQRQEITRLREALGLATTLKPDMEININDPVGMMQEVHKYVTSALAKEATRDIP